MACLVLVGCSANHYLRVAERAIAKAEAKGARWHNDTLVAPVAVPIAGVKHDTAFVDRWRETPGDTVVVKDGRLKVTYLRVRDTVRLNGECGADTIYKEVPRVVMREIKAPPRRFPWVWVALAFVGGAVVVWRLRG